MEIADDYKDRLLDESPSPLNNFANAYHKYQEKVNRLYWCCLLRVVFAVLLLVALAGCDQWVIALMGEMLWVPTLPFLKLLGIRFAASQNYILLMVVILVIGGMVEVYYLEIWWLWIVEGMGLIVMIWAAGKTYYFCNKCGNAQEQLSIDHCFSTQG